MEWGPPRTWFPSTWGARTCGLATSETYAREEERGGLTYAFRNPRNPETPMTAIEAWTHFHATGESPLSRWQSHLLVWEGR